MVEARLVEIHLHARLYGLLKIRPSGPLHQLGIRFLRYHEAHVDAGQGRCAHGEEHGLGGQEVGRLHIDILLGLEENAHVALHDVGPGRDRAGADHLGQQLASPLTWRGWQGLGIIFPAGDERAIDEIPVDEESPLHGIDNAPSQAEMGVAPGLVAGTLHVAQGNVHAADESRGAVDDAELAVVAVVHFPGEGRKPHGHEGLHLYAALAHPFEEPAFHVPASHVVVNDTHLHPLPSLGDEGIGKEPPQGVVGEDVGAEMDVVVCACNGFQQGGKEMVAVGIDVGFVVFEGQRQALIGEKLDERLVGGRQLEVALLHILEHRLPGQLVEALLADITFLAGVAPEEEIENDAHRRQEDKHQQPRGGLYGLLVVEEHFQNGTDDQQAVD